MSRRVYAQGDYLRSGQPDHKQAKENIALVREAFLTMFQETTMGTILLGCNVDVNRDALRELLDTWETQKDIIGHGMSELADALGETWIRG